jgi:hypothetical protein
LQQVIKQVIKNALLAVVIQDDSHKEYARNNTPDEGRQCKLFLKDPTSPQWKAIVWLVEEDGF